MKKAFALSLLALIALLQTGCSSRRNQDIRLGEKWVYRYEKIVEANPQSIMEPPFQEGLFYLLGGDLMDAKTANGGTGQVREYKIAFAKGKADPKAPMAFTAGALVDENGRMKPYWGVPPQDMDWLFFPLPADYRNGFTAELPGAKLVRMTYNPILTLQVKPYQPTEEDLRKNPLMKKGLVFKYKGTGKLDREVGRIATIRAKGGIVSIDGTLVVDPDRRRVLSRHEYHLLNMNVEGTLGGQPVRIYRQEIRKLDAVQ